MEIPNFLEILIIPKQPMLELIRKAKLLFDAAFKSPCMILLVTVGMTAIFEQKLFTIFLTNWGCFYYIFLLLV